MDIGILLTIGGLALLDTLSPTTIGVTVYLLLTDRDRLAVPLIVYLVTVATLYFAAGSALMLGLGYVVEMAGNIFENRIVSWIVFIIGAALFIASFYIPDNKSRNKAPKLQSPRKTSLLSMAAIGFTTFLIEGATAFPYFAAIGIMTAQEFDWIIWIPLLAGYNVIMILPPLILFFLHILLRGRMHRTLEKIRGKIAESSGSALSWVICIVGLILIFNTLDYL